MPDINITVAHKVVVSDTQTIVCDNSDYTVHWTLDEEWSAYDTKTMRTIYMDGTFEDKVFSGDTIELPVCTVPGAVQIGLFAGNIRTSRVAILRALPSARSAAGAPADPTPDVYDQLMERIAQLETPDWAQNDPTAKDYVRNRTHWVGDDGTVHTIDPKYIKDMYYSAIEEKNIAGMKITGTTYDGTEHDPLPFVLGQVWNAEFVTTSYNDLHVKQADDGTLYIGDLGLSSPPFFVSVTSGGANSAWENNMQPGGLTLIGVSGTVGGKVVHTLPDEYLSANIARKSDIPENRIMIITARGINADVNFGDYTDVLLLIKAATPGQLDLRLLLVNGKNKHIINCKTGSAVVDGEQPYGVMAIMCDVVNDTYTLLNPL